MSRSTCEICEKTFVNLSNLNKHKTTSVWCKQISEYLEQIKTQHLELEQLKHDNVLHMESIDKLKIVVTENNITIKDLHNKISELHKTQTLTLTKLVQPIQPQNTQNIQNNNTQNNNLVIRPHPKDAEAKEKLVP